MESVFLVWHVHQIPGYEDDEKLIGVYTTEEEANAAILRRQPQPGFNGNPSGFEIVAYELNKDHWCEGYVADSGGSSGGDIDAREPRDPQIAA